MGEQNEYLCDLDRIIWNIMGTQNSKKSHDPSPLPSPKENNIGLLECMLLHLIGCQEFLFHSSQLPFCSHEPCLNPGLLGTLGPCFFFLNLEF
jgi:hypothetical protein